MNGKLWACVITGVLVAHLALLVIISNVRSFRNPRPQVKVVEPNFFTNTTTFTDPLGRTVNEVSEFTVTTEFASEATLEKLPPPAEDAGEQQLKTGN